MRFTTILAAGAALSAALLSPATASPTVMSAIPDHISDSVRRELAELPAENYTLFDRNAGPSGSLDKRASQINGIQTTCRSDNCLSMTFDDGPYDWQRKVVDTLGNAGGQKGTFFVNGNNFRCIYDNDSVSRLRYAYERGHEICSHSWSHPDLRQLNNQQLDRQVQLVEDALWKILGVVPACFRAPYGNIREDQVRYLNDRWGLVVVGWNRDTNDANGASPDASLNTYRSLRPPQKAIVLNHETVRSTVDVVIPQAVNIVRQNGYGRGSQTVASTLWYNPYKVVGRYQNRDGSWTCGGKPGPGQFW